MHYYKLRFIGDVYRQTELNPSFLSLEGDKMKYIKKEVVGIKHKIHNKIILIWVDLMFYVHKVVSF